MAAAGWLALLEKTEDTSDAVFFVRVELLDNEACHTFQTAEDLQSSGSVE